MAEFLKKQGIAFWFNLVAIITAIVGLVAMNISSSIDTAYKYSSFTKILMMIICGLLLTVIAMWAPNKFGNHDILSTASVIGSVALYASAIGRMITERILLIAGLFSYNSQNMVGWSVFYATIVAVAALLISNIAIIIGAFNKSVKTK